MDCAKVGLLIAQLRKEKGLTQQSVASALGISNKTVSKWECGLGCPDVSLWADLSVILGADISQMMEGEITLNPLDAGNINKVRFHVCPSCNNVVVGTGSSSIFCCGRKLEQLTLNQDENMPHITTSIVESDYYITIDHEMTKEHYILFAAFVKTDTVILIRLYPEQSASVRFPCGAGGKLYLYCTEHGLTAHSLSTK